MTKQSKTAAFLSPDEMDPTEKSFHEALEAFAKARKDAVSFSDDDGHSALMFRGPIEHSLYLHKALLAYRERESDLKDKSRAYRCVQLHREITETIDRYKPGEILSVFMRLLLELTLSQDEPDNAFIELQKALSEQYEDIKKEKNL
jgi:hypothetical protein